MTYSGNYAGRATTFDDGDPILGAQVKNIYDELGPDPKAGAADLTARLGNIDAAIAGKANTSHGHDAAAITSGVIAPERLGTGVRSSAVYLDGTGQWSAPVSEALGVVVLDNGDTNYTGIPVGTVILRRQS